MTITGMRLSRLYLVGFISLKTNRLSATSFLHTLIETREKLSLESTYD